MAGIIKLLKLICLLGACPVLLGSILTVIHKERETGVQLFYKGAIIEIILCMGTGALSHSVDFFSVKNMFLGIIALCGVIGLISFLKLTRQYKHEKIEKKNIILLFILLIMFLIQVLGASLFRLVDTQDITIETVNAIISQNNIRYINPYTGRGAKGMTSLLYVFYAILVYTTDINSVTMISHVMPIWLLLVFYCFAYSVCKKMNVNRPFNVYGMMIIVMLLILFGARGEWLLSPYLLFEPWRPDHIAFYMVLPVLVSALIQWEKQTQKLITGIEIIALLFFFQNVNGKWAYIIVILVLLMAEYIIRRIYEYYRKP